MKQTHSVALAALLSVVLVGCSDNDPEPKIAPSPTPSSSSPAAPPSSAPPEPGETAVALSPEDTVRAWVEARNQAMQTGDTTSVDRLTDSECTSCRDLIDPIKTTYSEGGHYETAGWRVLRSDLDGSESKKRVTAALELAPGTTYPSADEEPVEYPAEKRIAVFELAPRGEAWRVSLIGFLR